MKYNSFKESIEGLLTPYNKSTSPYSVEFFHMCSNGVGSTSTNQEYDFKDNALWTILLDDTYTTHHIAELLSILHTKKPLLHQVVFEASLHPCAEMLLEKNTNASFRFSIF